MSFGVVTKEEDEALENYNMELYRFFTGAIHGSKQAIDKLEAFVEGIEKMIDQETGYLKLTFT